MRQKVILGCVKIMGVIIEEIPFSIYLKEPSKLDICLTVPSSSMSRSCSMEAKKFIELLQTEFVIEGLFFCIRKESALRNRNYIQSNVACLRVLLDDIS